MKRWILHVSLLALALRAPCATDTALEEVKARGRTEVRKPVKTRMEEEEQDDWKRILDSRSKRADLIQPLTFLRKYHKDPELRPLLDAAIEQVEREMKAGEEERLQMLKSVADRAVAALLRAERAADLDPVLRDLAAVVEKEGEWHDQMPPLRPIWTRTQAVRGYVRRWQDGMLAGEFGEPEAAKALFEQLKTIPDEADAAIDRSAIAARLSALQKRLPPPSSPGAESPPTTAQAKADAILAGLKSLQQLPAALAELRELALSYGPGSWPEGTETVLFLTHIHDAYANVRAGGVGLRAVSSSVRGDFGPKVPPGVEWLRAELLSLVLPKLIDPLSQSTERPESCAAYLKQEWLRALEKDEWDRAAQVAAVSAVLGIENVMPIGDQTALRFLRGARNFHSAGEFALATAYYERALASGGSIVETTGLKSRLAAIKRDHPAEYEQGLRANLQPTAR